MKLLIDVGNSCVKWALARAGELIDTGVVGGDRGSDWVGALPWARAEALYVASVADDSAVEALAARAQACGVALHRVCSGARSGRLINGYQEPSRLGVDRWLACIAAEARGSGSVLVADLGTALTLDWIGADGRHSGGLIAPGVASMRLALRTATQLRPAGVAEVHGWLAADTEGAIATGTLRCAIALIDAAAADLAPDRRLLTGGEWALVAPWLAHDWQSAPHLVLEGLAIHAERHSQGSQTVREPSE